MPRPTSAPVWTPLFLLSVSLLVLASSIAPAAAVSCTTHTGYNGTLVLPAGTQPTVDGEPVPDSTKIRVVAPDGECVSYLNYAYRDSTGQAAPIWGEDARYNPGSGIASDSAFVIEMKMPSSDRWVETTPRFRSGTLADTTRRYASNHLYVLDSLNTVTSDTSTSGQIHIVSVTVDKEPLSKGYKRGVSTVTLEDSQGNPVPEATVTGTFTGDFQETVSGLTGTDGSVTLRTSNSVRGGVSFSFTVDDITHATLTYSPSTQEGSSGARPSSPAATGPETFVLHGNYPNPFNPRTTVVFDLPARATVHLQVFNALGREVMARPTQEMTPGRQTMQIDASSLSSGLYFYRVTADMGARRIVHTDRMMLLK